MTEGSKASVEPVLMESSPHTADFQNLCPADSPDLSEV